MPGHEQKTPTMEKRLKSKQLAKVYVFIPMFSECISATGEIDFQRVAQKINELDEWLLDTSVKEGLPSPATMQSLISMHCQAPTRDELTKKIGQLFWDYIRSHENYCPKWDGNYALASCDRLVNAKGQNLGEVRTADIHSVEAFYNYRKHVDSNCQLKRAGVRHETNPSMTAFDTCERGFYYSSPRCEDNFIIYQKMEDDFVANIPESARRDYRGHFNNTNYVDLRECYPTALALFQNAQGKSHDALKGELRTICNMMPVDFVDEQFSEALREHTIMMLSKKMREQLDDLYLKVSQDAYMPSHSFMLRCIQDAEDGKCTWRDMEQKISQRLSLETHYRNVLLEIETNHWQMGLLHKGKQPAGMQKIKEVI